MTVKEREEEFEYIKTTLEGLDTFSIHFDYRDILSDMRERYTEMLDNENNEYHPCRDAWEKNNEFIEEILKEDLSCEPFEEHDKYNFVSKAQRDKAINDIKKHFKDFMDTVSEIKDSIDFLKVECEAIIQNCEDKVMLEDTLSSNQEMLESLEELELEKIEPWEEYVDFINSLGE